MVQTCNNHPAILAWAVGNELNNPNGYNSAVWSFVGTLKNLIHQTESPDWHPVGSPIADGFQLMTIVANASSSVDIWMLQIYRFFFCFFLY